MGLLPLVHTQMTLNILAAARAEDKRRGRDLRGRGKSRAGPDQAGGGAVAKKGRQQEVTHRGPAGRGGAAACIWEDGLAAHLAAEACSRATHPCLFAAGRLLATSSAAASAVSATTASCSRHCLSLAAAACSAEEGRGGSATGCMASRATLQRPSTLLA